MNSMTNLKSLGDIRSVVSTHTRSTPRHKGSAYLDTLSLGMEKQRLEAELAWLARRRGRIELRLQEIRKIMEGLLEKVASELPASSDSATPEGNARPPAVRARRGNWKHLTLSY